MESTGIRECDSARTNHDWLQDLRAGAPCHDHAVRALRALMLRGARHQVARLRATTPELSGTDAEDIIEQAADEAVVAVLGKLDTFEGRSRFTTWAYKFAILQTSTEVRRTAWRNREVATDILPEIPATSPTPIQVVEGSELAAAVAQALDSALTAHQRRVAIALLIDEVPIDVLADRLGSSRNVLYKTLHDARKRLRHHLADHGHLAEDPVTGQSTTVGASR